MLSQDLENFLSTLKFSTPVENSVSKLFVNLEKAHKIVFFGGEMLKNVLVLWKSHTFYLLKTSNLILGGL